jgi:hypothetical protein
MDYPKHFRRGVDGQDWETLVVDDPNHTWVSGAGERLALAVFFVGMALMAAGIVMYFTLNLHGDSVDALKVQKPAADNAIVIRPDERK